MLGVAQLLFRNNGSCFGSSENTISPPNHAAISRGTEDQQFTS